MSESTYTGNLRRYQHLLGLLLAFVLLGMSTAADQQQLTIYSPQTSFSVPVIERNGHDYVSVTDILDPFGGASFETTGKKWRLHFVSNDGKRVDGEFEEGSDRAQIGKRPIKFAAPFQAENRRGFVPMESASVVLTQLIGGSATLHANSRRLFMGGVSTAYSAELQNGSPAKLVLHFSARVNPTLAAEPGRLRMTFNREPIVASGTSPQSFSDSVIHSLAYNEGDGTAELVVNSDSPLLPTFSSDGKTITLTPASTPAQPVAQTPAQTSQSTSTAPGNPQSASTTQPTPQSQPKMIVIIDPAHGGDDTGAALGNGLQEKDLTLQIARRIRAELDARGIMAVLTRDSDVNMTLEQRAIAANTSRAVLYLGIHAANEGTGVRLFSAAVSGDPPKSGFLPWATAQGAFIDQSRAVKTAITKELGARKIATAEFPAFMRPLRNIAKPAIAIELAPSGDQGLTSATYVQSVANSVAAAVAEVRGSLERGQ